MGTMVKEETFDISVGSGIISIFQNQTYKIERIIAEFIDNSLQSFLDHQDELKGLNDGQICKVIISLNNEKVLISDNCYGMNHEEFGRALKLKSKNPRAKESGRLSIYGMGLKYAAANLGDNYKIISSRYGEKIFRSAEIDIKKLEEENPTETNASIYDDKEDNHYTIIEITNIRHKFTPNKILKLCENLGSIYEYYIKHNHLQIVVNDIKVTTTEYEYRQDGYGGRYFRNFDGELKTKNSIYRYTGHIGILAEGNQEKTGLRLIQANRCIQLKYKPEKIYKKGNSFQNQRLVGQIVFEGNQNIVSYDKGNFIREEDGTEERFIEQLLKTPEIKEMISTCKKLKKETNEESVTKKTMQGIQANNTTNTNKHSITKSEAETDFDNVETTSQLSETICVNEKEEDSHNEKILENLEVVTSENHSLNEFRFISGNEAFIISIELKAIPNGDWLKIEKADDNKYTLTINADNKFVFSAFKTNNENNRVSTNLFAIKLTTALILTKTLGLKEQLMQNLIDNFNEVLKN